MEISIPAADRLPARYPSYFPVLSLDPLLWVVGANRAYEDLFGPMAHGMHLITAFASMHSDTKAAHLIDVFFVSGVGDPDYGQARSPYASVMRAIGYFCAYTANYREESHPLYEEYQLTVASLRNSVNEFDDKCKTVNHIPRDLSPDDDPYVVTGAVRVAKYLQKGNFVWPLAILSLNVVVPRLPSGYPERAGESRYELTLVPQNPESEATVILAGLLAAFSPETWPEANDRKLVGLLWTAAALETLQHGLARADQESTWDAAAVFDRRLAELRAGVVGKNRDRDRAWLEEDIRGRLHGPLRRAVADWFACRRSGGNDGEQGLLTDVSVSHVVDGLRNSVYDNEYLKEVIGRATYGGAPVERFSSHQQHTANEPEAVRRTEAEPPRRNAESRTSKPISWYADVFDRAFKDDLERDAKLLFPDRGQTAAARATHTVADFVRIFED